MSDDPDQKTEKENRDDDLKEKLTQKENTIDEMFDEEAEDIKLIEELLTNPPYKTKDEEIIENYGQYVSDTFGSIIKKTKQWKAII